MVPMCIHSLLITYYKVSGFAIGYEEKRGILHSTANLLTTTPMFQFPFSAGLTITKLSHFTDEVVGSNNSLAGAAKLSQLKPQHSSYSTADCLVLDWEWQKLLQR